MGVKDNINCFLTSNEISSCLTKSLWKVLLYNPSLFYNFRSRQTYFFKALNWLTRLKAVEKNPQMLTEKYNRVLMLIVM